MMDISRHSFVGKITVGYQGWFACGGDGSPINGWWHWSNDWGRPPSRNNTAIKAWPDTTCASPRTAAAC
jgi:hypothetical protein